MAVLAAPMIAAARGLRCVDVGFGALVDRSLLQAAAEAAAPHWMGRGLEPDAIAGLFRDLYVDPCPPSLQNPEIASVPSVQLRPAAAVRSDGDVPDWLDRLDASSIVYLTMGTVWNDDLDLFRAVIDAVRGEDIALVVTVGRQNDPASLGPQPSNVVVHRFVPQNVLLPRCDAIVTHGGSGTMLGALAHGVPLLLLPQGADQYANADRVVAAGAGRQLLRGERSVDAIRESLLAILGDRRFRGAAERIASEIELMPDAPAVVPAIERLAHR
jgi:UDP:flavonoid glycosyltransferase YjiC (YdhE family)